MAERAAVVPGRLDVAFDDTDDIATTRRHDVLAEAMRDVSAGRCRRAGEVAAVRLWLPSPGAGFDQCVAGVAEGGLVAH